MKKSFLIARKPILEALKPKKRWDHRGIKLVYQKVWVGHSAIHGGKRTEF